MLVKCKICGSILKAKARANFRAPNRDSVYGNNRFPVYHMRTKFEPCHGFYIEGVEIENER